MAQFSSFSLLTNMASEKLFNSLFVSSSTYCSTAMIGGDRVANDQITKLHNLWRRTRVSHLAISDNHKKQPGHRWCIGSPSRSPETRYTGRVTSWAGVAAPTGRSSAAQSRRHAVTTSQTRAHAPVLLVPASETSEGDVRRPITLTGAGTDRYATTSNISPP